MEDADNLPQKIVYPVRVDPFNVKQENNFAFPSNAEQSQENVRLKRQSPTSSDPKNYDISEGSESQDESVKTDDEEEVFVRIENADEDLFLQLRPNKGLRTVGTVIEWVLASGATILKTAPENCYLVGSTVGDVGKSLVAVSSCSGLTGLIQTSKNSYFIEPLRNRHNASSWKGDSDFLNPTVDRDFVEYRRTSANESITSSDDSSNDRYSYQEHRRHQEILSVPEPHVIYKVNTILERLNISLHEDQKYSLATEEEIPALRRKRSSVDTSPRSKFKAGTSKKGNSAKTNENRRKGGALKRKKNKTGTKRKRKRRKRRHDKKKASRKCRQMEEGESRLECEERRAKRKEERQKRRQERQRMRRERRRNRRKKKRNKQQPEPIGEYFMICFCQVLSL